MNVQIAKIRKEARRQLCGHESLDEGAAFCNPMSFSRYAVMPHSSWSSRGPQHKAPSDFVPVNPIPSSQTLTLSA